jgi:protein TonB
MQPLPLHSYRYQPSPGSRATAFILSLAICALIVLVLIRMGMLTPGRGSIGERLTAFSVRPQPSSLSYSTVHRKAVAKTQQSHAHLQNEQAVQTTQPVPTPVTPPLHLLKLSKEEFAAADISKMARHSSDDSTDSGAGHGSATAYGPGEGPGGARLYNAEWYREPSHAELVTYLPHRDIAGGWAMIACKTQEKFHVDDCQELSESPPGSGLARALRLAAWQFLVRPPRIEGHPLIGVWVRIRFDFTRAEKSDGHDDGPPDPNGG